MRPAKLAHPSGDACDGPQQAATKYQIWSTVLGSNITEVGHTGLKLKTKVFAGSAAIAEQMRAPYSASDQVVWMHSDPVTGSTTHVNKDGSEWYRNEYEPLGQEINVFGTEEEFPPPPVYGDSLMSDAHDPQWKCQLEREMSTNFWDWSVRCQEAAIANMSSWELFPSDGDPTKIDDIVDSPNPKIPTPHSPTEKPDDHTLAFAASSAPKNRFLSMIVPDDDGDDDCSKDGDGDPNKCTINAPPEIAGMVDASEVNVPLPGDFRERLKQRIESKQPGQTMSCNDFIAQIIAKAIANFNRDIKEVLDKAVGQGNPPFVPIRAEATDGLDLLKKIRNFTLSDNVNVNGHGAGGTVRGSISGGDAEVLIKSKSYRLPVARGFNPVKMWTNWYIGTAIHEMVHLAARGVTNDSALAKAAFDLGYTKEKVTNVNTSDVNEIYKHSDTWNGVLGRFCGRRW